MHHLFNVVTNQKNIPDAVLIRAIKPFEGIDEIIRRRKLKQNVPLHAICPGPGTVSQALGIRTSHNGENLVGNKIWIEDRGIKITEKNIIKNPRIGVDYAGSDALLPYRFTINV
jgi:DNA-3-methyladenine glycosylase